MIDDFVFLYITYLIKLLFFVLISIYMNNTKNWTRLRNRCDDKKILKYFNNVSEKKKIIILKSLFQIILSILQVKPNLKNIKCSQIFFSLVKY